MSHTCSYAISAYNRDNILSNREEIILNYLPKVKFIANHILYRLPSYIDIDDLISIGTLGLIDSIDKFDDSKNIKFNTYAEFRIKGAIIDELRSLDLISRTVRQKTRKLEKAYSEIEGRFGRPATYSEIIDFLDITIDEFYDLLNDTKNVSVISIDELSYGNDRNILNFLADPNCLDPVQLINLNEIYELISNTINELPEKEKIVISLYYNDELIMKDIASILSISESRVSQIHARAIIRLRSKLNLT